MINGSRIDDVLLAKKSITRCNIATCKGGCCSDGVWVDMAEANAIRANADMIKPFMPADRHDVSEWFGEYHNDDAAFPSGEYTGTNTVMDPTHPNGETCIFLRPEDRHCAIQVASVANGLSSWALKPHYCCLFPLVDTYEEDVRTVTMDYENSLFDRGHGCFEGCVCAPQPVFQIYAEETALAIGLDGYRALCEATGEAPRL